MSEELIKVIDILKNSFDKASNHLEIDKDIKMACTELLISNAEARQKLKLLIENTETGHLICPISIIEVRKLEKQDPRVETGNVRFGDDWSGLFIRGDHCFDFASNLNWLLANTQMPSYRRDALNSLLKLLRGTEE